MANFDTYMLRHGEPWVQGLVEQIERNEGICYDVPIPLEDRWHVVMDAALEPQQFLIAQGA